MGGFVRVQATSAQHEARNVHQNCVCWIFIVLGSWTDGIITKQRVGVYERIAWSSSQSPYPGAQFCDSIIELSVSQHEADGEQVKNRLKADGGSVDYRVPCPISRLERKGCTSSSLWWLVNNEDWQ